MKTLSVGLLLFVLIFCGSPFASEITDIGDLNAPMTSRTSVAELSAMEGESPHAGLVIVDDADDDFSVEGDWNTSTNRPGYYGDGYLHTKYGDILSVATWSFNVSGGRYKVAAQWSSYPNRTAKAKYTILNNGQELGSAQANQKESGGEFNTLGTFVAEEGTLSVTLDNSQEDDGYIIADAVMILPFIVEVQSIAVTWDYSANETRATGFDIRVNKDDSSLISVSKDVREWIGDVELVRGENVFDMRTRGSFGVFSVWSEPAFYTLEEEIILLPPRNLKIKVGNGL